MPHAQPLRQNHLLTGRTVVMADGDQIGVVEAVIDAASSAADALLVVSVTDTGAVSSEHLYIPEGAIHTVTEADVVLGTRADWISPLHWTQPPADE